MWKIVDKSAAIISAISGETSLVINPDAMRISETDSMAIKELSDNDIYIINDNSRESGDICVVKEPQSVIEESADEEPKPEKREITKKMVEEWIKMSVQEKKTQKEIAILNGVSQNTISNHIRKHMNTIIEKTDIPKLKSLMRAKWPAKQIGVEFGISESEAVMLMERI